MDGDYKLVVTATNAASSASNTVDVTLNNADGFHVVHTAPSNSTTLSDATVWYGGLDAAGRGSLTLVPVVYTSGRSIVTARATVGGSATCTSGGASSSTTSYVPTGIVVYGSTSARPWSFTYGRTTATSTTNNSSTNIICSGEGSGVSIGTITSVTYDNGAAGPTDVLNTVPSINGDWAAPTAAAYAVTAPTAGTTSLWTAGSNEWVNGSYNFLATANFTAGADAGVGLPTASSRLVQVRGCPVSSDTTWVTVSTGADLAECENPSTDAAYQVRWVPRDRLGNQAAVATWNDGANNYTFGVDKIAPTITYAAATDTNGTIYTATGADIAFEPRVIDDRSGPSIGQYSLVQTTNFRTSSTTSRRAGYCLSASTPTNSSIGTSFITAPSCSYTATGVSIGATADATTGTLEIVTNAKTVSDLVARAGGATYTNGYYTFRARVYDRAGNLATADPRYILVETEAPTVTADDYTDGTFFNATTGITVTGTTAAKVEVKGQAMGVGYDASGTRHEFEYPSASAGRSLFDNVTLVASETFSGTLPFTSGTKFYTNLQLTGASDAVSGGATATVSDAYIIGFNFSDLAAGAATGSKSVATLVSADATAWPSKTNASNLTTFKVVANDAGFNAPAGGIKAQAIASSNLLNSPFTRVDFYRYNLVSGTNRYTYLGSVDATSCVANTGCGVYRADAGNRTWTYQYTGSFANYSRQLLPQTVFAVDPDTGDRIVGAGEYVVAVGVGQNTNGTTGAITTAGRALVSAPYRY